MNAPLDPREELIEAALTTYPLAALPPGFTRRALSRLRSAQKPAPFRLLWLDYALFFFLSALAGGLYLFWKLIPRQFLLQLDLQRSILQARFSPVDWLPALAIVGVVLLSMAALAAVVSIRPRVQV